MNQYPVGEQIILTGSFYGAGVLADPTAVTGELILPDQSVIALTPAKRSTGIYDAPYTPLFVSGVVNGAANNGSGLIRLAIDATLLASGMKIDVAGIVGTVEANAEWVITKIDAAHVDLVGSVFTHAYVSGGTWVKPIPNGLHQYRFAGTGAVVAAVEGAFLVQTGFQS